MASLNDRDNSVVQEKGGAHLGRVARLSEVAERTQRAGVVASVGYSYWTIAEADRAR